MSAFSAFRFHNLAVCVLLGFHAEPCSAAPIPVPMKPNLGAEMPLNEKGYQKVAALKSDGDMKTFTRRVLQKLGLMPTDEGALSGFASYFSGTNATQDLSWMQDYQHLEEQVRKAKWVRKADGSENATLPTTQSVDDKGQRVLSPLEESVKDLVTASVPGTVSGIASHSRGIKTKVPKAHLRPHRRNKRAPRAALSLLGAKSVTGKNESTATLPAVGQVLSAASQTLKDFSVDAYKMQRQVAERQNASRAKLILVKRRCEQKLKLLKAEHEAAITENDHLRSKIRKVNETNDGLVAEATAQQHSIKSLLGTISTLREKMTTATSFVAASFNETDVDNAVALEVLQSTTAQPTLENLISKAREELGLPMSIDPAASAATDDDDDEVVALLQVPADVFGASTGKGPNSPDPEKLTALLMESLVKLDEAEQTAYEKLQANFETSKRKWTVSNEKLLAEQQGLQKQLEGVTKRRTDLEEAKQVVTDRNQALQRRMRDFDLFLKLSDEAVEKTLELVAGKRRTL